MATVPSEHKEAALALGATRWEMIRMAVLPYARPGITGGAMLGLGRAIGETIAVVLVIGDAPVIGQHLFNQGYTLAAVIANEFGEAANTADPQLGAVRGRPGAVRAHAAGQHRRALVRGPRDPRAARAAGGGDVRSRDRGVGAANERHVALPHDQRPAPAHRPGRCAALLLAATVIALIPLVLVIYYLLDKGLGSWSGQLLHHRPQRQLLRQSGRDPQRDPRHARDRRPGHA